MFGLFPKKGTIAVGSDADIVIFDPEEEHTFGVEHEHMNVEYSSYEGWKMKGKVETVLSRGRVVIENGEHKGKAGDGHILRRGECVKIERTSGLSGSSHGAAAINRIREPRSCASICGCVRVPFFSCDFV